MLGIDPRNPDEFAPKTILGRRPCCNTLPTQLHHDDCALAVTMTDQEENEFFGEEAAIDRRLGTQDAVVQVAKLRVIATWMPISPEFATLDIAVTINERLFSLTPSVQPMLVAQRYGGPLQDRSMTEEIVAAAVKRELELGGAYLLDLSGEEVRRSRDTRGRLEISWWATLGARLSVAVQYQSDGSVRVVALG